MGMKRSEWRRVKRAGLAGPRNEGKSRATRKGKVWRMPSITAKAFTMPATAKIALGRACRVRVYEPRLGSRWGLGPLHLPVIEMPMELT